MRPSRHPLEAEGRSWIEEQTYAQSLELAVADMITRLDDGELSTNNALFDQIFARVVAERRAQGIDPRTCPTVRLLVSRSLYAQP